MQDEKVSRWFFIGFLLLFLVLTFLVIKSFFTYIFLAIILVFSFYPVYRRINKKLKKPTLTSAIMVSIILLLLVIPSFFAVTNLVRQTGAAYSALRDEALIGTVNDFLLNTFHAEINVDTYLRGFFTNIQDFIVNSAPNLISSIADVGLGLFVMFFTMFYLFKGGESFYEDIKDLLPLKKKYKHKLTQEIRLVLHGVLYGQIMTAIIQGGLGGILLFVFGVPNALFWGFIMIILSFLPVVGTPLVWVPAGIYQIITGQVVQGILILAIGATVVANIDNIIKPKLISGRSKIHPVVALIGVLGGLNVFGLIGIIVGPLVIALFLVLLRFYNEDFKFGLQTVTNEG